MGNESGRKNQGRVLTSRTEELNLGRCAIDRIANLEIGGLSMPEIVDELVKATKIIGHPSTSGLMDDMIIHAVMEKIQSIPDESRWSMLAKIFEIYNNSLREEARKVTDRDNDVQELRRAMVEIQSDYV
jgi:hypothetical protein